MELGELKNAWQSLDSQLHKQNILKESVLRNLIEDRSDRALSKLMKTEKKGMFYMLFLYVAFLPFFRFLSSFAHSDNVRDNIIKAYTYETGAIWIAIYAFSLIAFIWQGWKVFSLMKFDFSNPLSENIRTIEKYNIYIKWERNLMLILVPTLFCTFLLVMIPLKVVSWVGLLIMAGFFVLLLVKQWLNYKNKYECNIKEIQRSIDKLKELEEE